MNLNSEPVIHVGILLSQTIHFELKGNFTFNNQLVKPKSYNVKISDGLICTEFGCSKTIELLPIGESTFILQNVVIGIGFHWEQKENQEFAGGLTLQMEGSNIRAVNTVPLESYLKSVISSEMSAMNDLTLLKTHAIVSRSWLLAQIQNAKKNTTDYFDFSLEKSRNDGSITEITKWYDREDHETFDVCADDHCQRYQGITKVISEKAEDAVKATYGLVLMYQDKICDARFSKCCGGITENFENVWQPVKVPYLTSVFDNEKPYKFLNHLISEDFISSSPEAFCNTTDPKILSQVLIDFDQKTTDFFRWTKSFSQNELSALLQKKSGIEFGEIIDLVPLERGSSGRIIQLKIVGTLRTAIVGKELEIRKWLSESHLYSSAFIVEKEFDGTSEIPSKFILKGAGWGHGVGMCQIGAAVMSQQGFTSEEILKHYFKNAKLNKLY